MREKFVPACFFDCMKSKKMPRKKISEKSILFFGKKSSLYFTPLKEFLQSPKQKNYQQLKNVELRQNAKRRGTLTKYENLLE